jgi:hypothetical protein
LILISMSCSCSHSSSNRTPPILVFFFDITHPVNRGATWGGGGGSRQSAR